MSGANPQECKALLLPLRAAQRDFIPDAVSRAFKQLLAPNALIRLCHPFGDLIGPEAFFDCAYGPMLTALPDLERRDWIVMAGSTAQGTTWLGCGGHYVGTFVHPLLGIPPTGHVAALRFHEFYRIADEKVVEIQAIWDLPELMMQARAWPMAPALGREWLVPGPATQDGLTVVDRDEGHGARSLAIVADMLAAMQRHPREPEEAMELPRYWHENMMWYGPAGIGTARGIRGFRNWHQIPFLNAMPDRGQRAAEAHFFGEGNYVAVTGWPNMIQTLTGDGWLGIAPSGKQVAMRSLDFWRIDGDKIGENWVLIDLLDVYRQLGVDVLARMREFNKSRHGMTEYAV